MIALIFQDIFHTAEENAKLKPRQRLHRHAGPAITVGVGDLQPGDPNPWHEV